MVATRFRSACPSALLASLLLLLQLSAALAHPSQNGTTNTKSVRFPSSGSQSSLPSAERLAKETQNPKDSETSPASARFGFLSNSIYPTFGTQNSAYPQGGQYAATSPLKLDLGGLLLGGAIGLGVIFLLPKLFSPGLGSGCYQSRSADGGQAGTSQFLERLDQALLQHNIDSSSCAQRALCTYVQGSSTRISDGSASSFDKIVGDISSKASAEQLFGSSDYQRALDVGRTSASCANAFPHCPSDSGQLFSAVKSFIGNML